MPDSSMVQAWLLPLQEPDAPCGKDLEHDNRFLELTQAAQGKPETQFSPGEPPDWRGVREQAAALMEHTRDLRIALLWMRAGLHLLGFGALSPGLQLLSGLIDGFWDHVHPLPDPDDGDQYPRGNALAILPEVEGVLGDLRQCVLVRLRGAGDLRLRSVAVALGLIGPAPDEQAYAREQIAQMLGSAQEQDPEFRERVLAAVTDLQALSGLMNDKLGVADAPNLRPLLDLVKGVANLLPAADDAPSDAPQEGEDASATPAAPRSGMAFGGISSREDALRAIDLVCEYLERHEPSNPAQMLLRRARKLVGLNFLQLIAELAPEGLNEAARLMGVDPSGLNSSHEDA